MPGRQESTCKGPEACVKNKKAGHEVAKPQPSNSLCDDVQSSPNIGGINLFRVRANLAALPLPLTSCYQLMCNNIFANLGA